MNFTDYSNSTGKRCFTAMKFIHERFCEDISVDDAARVAMLSQSYFRYIFKQMTQKTFTEYINSPQDCQSGRAA